MTRFTDDEDSLRRRVCAAREHTVNGLCLCLMGDAPSFSNLGFLPERATRSGALASEAVVLAGGGWW